MDDWSIASGSKIIRPEPFARLKDNAGEDFKTQRELALWRELIATRRSQRRWHGWAITMTLCVAGLSLHDLWYWWLGYCR